MSPTPDDERHDGEHLSDDALSAFLDGEATPEEASHAASCPVCAGRLEQLRAASRAIGTALPPVDPARRDAAIATAVAARAVPIESRRRRPPGWILGAAAAAIAAVALLPLLLSGGDDHPDEVATAPTEDSGATMFSLLAPIDAGQLGVLRPEDVRDRVAAVLEGSAGAGAGTEAAPSGPDAADEDGSTTRSAQDAVCVDELRTGSPDIGELRLVGRATMNGRAAQVLAFEVPGDTGTTVKVFVVAVDNCDDILHFVSFTR